MSEPEDERIDYELDKFMEERGYNCSIAAGRVNDLEVENYRLKKIEAAAVEYVRDSYRPEPKYDAERFDKLVATLPNGVRLEGVDGDE